MPAEQPENTVTLPAADWQMILAGLYELQGKFGIPVINRLQAELQKTTVEEPKIVTPLKRGND